MKSQVSAELVLLIALYAALSRGLKLPLLRLLIPFGLLGTVIGGIVVAMYLPIFKLGQVV